MLSGRTRQIPGSNLSGLTRFSLACMEQAISLQILAEMTRIPAPTLSNYALGRRRISRTHLPILAIALDIHPATDLRGLANGDQVFIDEDELSEYNPLPIRYYYQLYPWHPNRPRQIYYPPE